jgi:hypothetical protein
LLSQPLPPTVVSTLPTTAPMLSRTTTILLPLAAAAAALAIACHHETTKTPEPPPDPPEVAEIVEWLVGEQVRSPKTSNRSVGLVLLDIDAKALGEGTLKPKSCAAELVSVIAISPSTDEWLGVDESPTLHRYSPEGWAAVPTKITLPPLAKLLAVARDEDGSLLVLVHKQGDNEQLWRLTLSGGVVTGIQGIDRKGFRDRPATLEAYDSGRCLGLRDCLHLTSIGQDVVLSREPELYAFWETKMELGNTGARDVRYVGDGGKKKIGLLVGAPCDPAAAATASLPAATSSPPTTPPPPGSASPPKRSP